jgi:hypothetical protein
MRRKADRSLRAKRSARRVERGRALANAYGGTVVFANDFFDERACFVVWSSSGGNDTCAHGQAEIKGLAGLERHHFVADLNIHCGARVVAKAEFDQLCLGEHRMNRGGDGGRSSIDCWDRKKRGSDYCDDGKAIVAFHCELPMLQDCDGNFLPWFRKLVVG